MSGQKYRHVGIGDPNMRMAYDIARAFYRYRGWNLKTTPVAVIAKGGRVLSVGVSGDGMHAMLGECARLDLPGSPYGLCEWCREEKHAEHDALLRLDPALAAEARGATCYLYGHWRMCDGCVESLRIAGVTDLALLSHSRILFDRHDPETVIGRPEQFEIQ